jgi:predicted SAM-dependent methyltransferase
MYSKLKEIALFVVPPYFLQKAEFIFRYIISVFYYGNKVYCTICQKNYSKFITLENGDQLCAGCGSLPRHRRLWKLINEEEIINPDDIILHFSPERCITKKLEQNHKENYHTTDYDTKSNTQLHFDITQIAAKDQTYSYIICYHVLEHIENDIKAMKELFRILKPNGRILIQTPFKEGDNYENKEVKTKEERLKHFGQDDHVRIYSVEGLKKRLESVGFHVTLKQYTDENDIFFGFKSKEVILICLKVK